MTRKKLKKRDVERLENTGIAVPLLDNLGIGGLEEVPSDPLGCSGGPTECMDGWTHCHDGKTEWSAVPGPCSAEATVCSGESTVGGCALGGEWTSLDPAN